MTFALDEQKIQDALWSMLINKGNEIVIPNLSWAYLPWEADMISITKAGFLNEYEVKISYSDFINDFKKRKHRFLTENANHKYHNIPNYFWYVAPTAIFPICIPDYAGIIEIIQQKHHIYFSTVRRPRLLHKHKLKADKKLSILRTVMFRYWKMSSQLTKYKVQRELFAR